MWVHVVYVACIHPARAIGGMERPCTGWACCVYKDVVEADLVASPCRLAQPIYYAYVTTAWNGIHLSTRFAADDARSGNMHVSLARGIAFPPQRRWLDQAAPSVEGFLVYVHRPSSISQSEGTDGYATL